MSEEGVAVEIKASVADFRTDRKWPAYLDYCEGFYFAVGPGFPVDILPETGLIRADAYDAAVLREPAWTRLAPARRRLTLDFARLAARRLEDRIDPAP